MLDPVLQELNAELDATISTLGMSEDRLIELTSRVSALVNKEAEYNDTVDDLMQRVSMLCV